MSNLIKHAERELALVGDIGYDGMLQEAVTDLIVLFANQGHSGQSAFICIDLFRKLANFEPLKPLTGEDSEWTECADGVFQNNRCSRVFKQADRFDGQAYDINGRIFREPDGSCYTNSDSFVPVVFPYTPTTKYVDVPKIKDS